MPAVTGVGLGNVTARLSLEQAGSNKRGHAGNMAGSLTAIGNVPLTNAQTPRYLKDGPGADVGLLAGYAVLFGDECEMIMGASVNPVLNVSTVDASTMQALRSADNAIRHTKELMPLGAANQAVDIWRTNAGNVYARRERLLTPDGMSVDAIMKSGVGNCAEHALVTKAVITSEPTDRPVMRVRAEGVDHNFVILGDPRELSEKQVVVADSWVTFPMAHLLSEGQFGVGSILDQTPPKSQAEALQVSGELKSILDDKGLRSEAEAHLKKLQNSGGFFEEHVSVKTIGNAYHEVGGESVRFDGFPSSWIESRINAIGEFTEWSEKGSD